MWCLFATRQIDYFNNLLSHPCCPLLKSKNTQFFQSRWRSIQNVLYLHKILHARAFAVGFKWFVKEILNLVQKFSSLNEITIRRHNTTCIIQLYIRHLIVIWYNWNRSSQFLLKSFPFNSKRLLDKSIRKFERLFESQNNWFSSFLKLDRVF